MIKKSQQKNTLRQQFAEICEEFLKKDDKAVVLIGDISHYLLKGSQLASPNRFYNIGICEQSTVSLAAGMALEGMRPIVHTIAPFLVERAYEQIKIGLGYQKTDVTLVVVGGTYDYSDLGCTHHCYSDIALMRSIPGMEVYEPSTSKEFTQLFKAAWANGNPKYFRISSFQHSQKIDKVSPGELNIIRESKNDKWVFVCGGLLDDVMDLPDSFGVIYVSTLSHISNCSQKIIKDLTNINSKVYSVENHSKVGGLGDLISDHFDFKVNKIGLEREFITEYGSYEDLRKTCGMDKESILKKLG
jgi:transketolase